MQDSTKPCKVCGKPFVPCLTQLPSGFNWRTVACSPECGQKYLHKIMVSRGLIVEDHPEPEVIVAEFEEVAEDSEVEINETEEKPVVKRNKKK